MSIRTVRNGRIAGATEVTALVGRGSIVDGNLDFSTIDLRECSFSGAYSIAAGALKWDRETEINAIAAGVTLGGVTTLFTPQAGSPKVFTAIAAANNQFLGEGTSNAASFATEADAQMLMTRTYLIRNLRVRAPSVTATVTVRKGGAGTSLTATAASGNASDIAIAHWVTGNAFDLISLQVTDLSAPGVVRATFEVVFGAP